MIGLTWNTAAGAADVLLAASGGLGSDDGLTSAVILSLFLDSRASADDRVDDGDRRGWVGDAFAPADRMGSRLWLLRREKQTEETRRRAEDYATEALAWLTASGLATSVAVTGAWVALGVLGLRIGVATPAGVEQFVFVLRL